ncbi:ABC transporter ATP-binding protein [Ferrovum sp. PN-J185]|uniref:ABC transporter ATP-binding protein n=1 Tax=Ferrovum sp. PN-J185 TaxID=1356306 RepID=UPI0007994D49|nr:ABC transporter ATP-binding protein [Ferrovum sp. PN-J185]KXW56754.1 putative ABC transporter ATP-binding protein [Ferrovum sp. PN-J185]MCC6068216.1 ABC transporter ATP-binding protein [Ferrovum sp. PN-J185]MDE1891322.1 ABC transporter ATP-binding protein [Betaproteobacteria bacterium]MDE2056152.1 ABC transporter ATP-binding protein [Betaproteobacteria bacterium]
MSTLLEIDDLHFNYANRKVLQGISLTIPEGKVSAILGTSGCGKTTLLKLIGGQLKPSQGAVKYYGRVVHEMNDSELYAMRREMGMMFQQGGLFSDLTVFENIAFPLREHTRLPEKMIRDLVYMKLEAVGLRGARDLYPAELSGGMNRRVCLARAIAMDPNIAIYDEPFAGLDPISLNAVAKLVRHLNDTTGITSIVVTYDVSETLKVVDYIYLISDGQLVASGDPQSMIHSSNPYAHQFINAEADGPVPFQVTQSKLEVDFRLQSINI